MKLVITLGARDEHAVDVVTRWAAAETIGVELVDPPASRHASARQVRRRAPGTRRLPVSAARSVLRRRPMGRPSPRMATRSSSPTSTSSRTARTHASFAFTATSRFATSARTFSETSRARSPVTRASCTAACGAVATDSHFSLSRCVEPRLGRLRRHDVMHARVHGHARADAADRAPEPRVVRAPRLLVDPLAELHAARDRHALERRERREQLVGRLGHALRLLELRLRRRDHRIERVADRRLHRLGEPARHAAPRDEELLPASRLVGKREAPLEQRPRTLDARGIARIAEARAQAVAEQAASRRARAPPFAGASPVLTRRRSASARVTSIVHVTRSPSTFSRSRRTSFVSRGSASFFLPKTRSMMRSASPSFDGATAERADGDGADRRASGHERRGRRRHRRRARSALAQLELEAVLAPRRAGLPGLGARELELPRREQLAAEMHAAPTPPCPTPGGAPRPAAGARTRPRRSSRARRPRARATSEAKRSKRTLRPTSSSKRAPGLVAHALLGAARKNAYRTHFARPRARARARRSSRATRRSRCARRRPRRAKP